MNTGILRQPVTHINANQASPRAISTSVLSRMSSVLAPLSNQTFHSFSSWVNPSPSEISRVDFISVSLFRTDITITGWILEFQYLYNNYPERVRSTTELKAISDYQTAIHDIAVEEDTLVTLSSNHVRSQLSQVQFSCLSLTVELVY